MDTNITFIALETYSLVGGLQNFNRRMISCFDEFSAQGNIRPAAVLLLRDAQHHVPTLRHSSVVAFGTGRLKFALSAIRSAVSRGGVLAVGHINLLPIAWIAKRLRPDLKTVLFVHGDEVWGDARHRTPRRYEPWMLGAIDRVASVSDYTAARMQHAFRLGKGKFALFPNAVDPLEVVSSRTGSPVPTVLTVTRLGLADSEKKIDELIKAMAVLKRRGTECHLEIVGDGVLRTELAKLVRQIDVEDRVRFLGRVDDDGLQEAYRRASVFALPSTKEGFGIVYLEAWQHNLPVICSTEGASHEIISEGSDGFAVVPGDIEGLANRIHHMVIDPQSAAELGRSGCAKVKAKYLHTHFKENLYQLIYELAA